eukprot:Phypoly_transcript_11528.p1 GENE.Phypoly_transcript_11528~~Phypoly_transcript_11528.p1  ORF type:complete len:304 (+),score=39.32 Phypoly_transcript_11528:238-1149(+)
MANEDELTHAHELFWKYFNLMFPNIKRDDMSTWKDDNWPVWSETGIISDKGIGQSELLWFVRMLPKVKRAYSHIWQGEQDLIVSFDAAGAARPPDFNKEWKTQGGWFHFDQNGYMKKGRQCVQGLLNILPSGEKDGGLCLVPKTHILFNKMFSERTDICQSSVMMDFVKLTRPGFFPEIWNDPQYQPIKLCLDPGDFALWDSRTAHCNHPASCLNITPEAKLRRLVAYVCMTPIWKVVNQKVLESRVKGFKNGKTTSHWPHEYQPRGGNFPDMPKPTITQEMKELIVGKKATEAGLFDKIYAQ